MTLRRATYRTLLIFLVLLAGCFILVESWGAFFEIAINYSNGRPAQLYMDQVILYGIPSLELGLLCGMVVYIRVVGWSRSLTHVVIAVWSQVVINFVLVMSLARF
jgi:hypothetical protein